MTWFDIGMSLNPVLAQELRISLDLCLSWLDQWRASIASRFKLFSFGGRIASAGVRSGSTSCFCRVGRFARTWKWGMTPSDMRLGVRAALEGRSLGGVGLQWVRLLVRIRPKPVTITSRLTSRALFEKLIASYRNRRPTKVRAQSLSSQVPDNNNLTAYRQLQFYTSKSSES